MIFRSKTKEDTKALIRSSLTSGYEVTSITHIRQCKCSVTGDLNIIDDPEPLVEDYYELEILE